MTSCLLCSRAQTLNYCFMHNSFILQVQKCMWKFFFCFTFFCAMSPSKDLSSSSRYICSFSSFQKYFSKRTRKQKCNLHLINMKSLFGLLHLISGFSWYWNHLWFTSRSGKTSWPLWVCINLRMCPRLLASHLQHDFSGLAERNVWNL